MILQYSHRRSTTVSLETCPPLFACKLSVRLVGRDQADFQKAAGTNGKACDQGQILSVFGVAHLISSIRTVTYSHLQNYWTVCLKDNSPNDYKGIPTRSKVTLRMYIS